MREFACRCCRRLLPFFANLGLEELITFGESRCTGKVDKRELEALRNPSCDLYDALYPGFGDPSPEVCALSAVSSVAFTESALTAAVHAADFAASAIAKSAAIAGPDDEYDPTFDAVYAAESEEQMKLLKALLDEARASSHDRR